MQKLTYISNENLRKETAFVISKAINAQIKAARKFGANVIDPFATLFEISGFSVNFSDWKENETTRQAQKTLQNHVGAFHQRILGHVEGWEDKRTGSQVDLICIDKRIIAEVKNKYSTVTGGKLVDVYNELSELVTPKASTYKDFTAYFVTIIPKTPVRFDLPFTPSNKKKGSKCEKNELIRTIDGASFYHLVTGKPDALEELYKVLPTVIEEILVTDYKKTGYKIENMEDLLSFFDAAFKNKPAKMAGVKKTAAKKVAVKKVAVK
jgi:hypothetical protein